MKRLTDDRLRALEDPMSPISHAEVLALVAEVRASRAAPSVPREVEEARNAVRASLDVTDDGPATCHAPWCGKEYEHSGECDSALIDWWGERDAIRAALRLLGGADGKEG